MNLKSTVNKQWSVVSQVIHFSDWNKRTFHGILTDTIQDWAFCKFKTVDWRLVMVNTNNVDCIEVFCEE